MGFQRILGFEWAIFDVEAHSGTTQRVGFHWPSGNSPVFRTKCVNFCCNRVLLVTFCYAHIIYTNCESYQQEKKQFLDIIVRFRHQKVNLLTHSVKFRVGNFDVGTTRYPRGKWGISNKSPTSGPPTVGFPRVVLSLMDMYFST